MSIERSSGHEFEIRRRNRSATGGGVGSDSRDADRAAALPVAPRPMEAPDSRGRGVLTPRGFTLYF